jgi:hypothetical protein
LPAAVIARSVSDEAIQFRAQTQPRSGLLRLRRAMTVGFRVARPVLRFITGLVVKREAQPMTSLPNPHPERDAPTRSPVAPSERRGDALSRFVGGPPGAVVFRLVLLSILVGVVLAAIGLDPWNIIRSIEDLIRGVWNMGFEAVLWVWRYFLLGAVLVIPIWLAIRIAKRLGRG